jgi:hypothetical protein
MTSSVLPAPSLPKAILDLIREEIQELHNEIQNHVEAALHRALRVGGKLLEVQNALKHARIYGDWIDANLPFSARSARDYVTLFRNRELIEHESSNDRLSIRASLKMIRDTAKAAEPRALEVCPLEIDILDEEVEPEEEEVRLAEREVLLIEAEPGIIGEIASLIRAAKRAGKDVKFQRLGAFDTDVPLDRPFDEILRRPVPETHATRAKRPPALK